MPIQFRCPQCKTRLSISRKRSGSEIKCPSCAAMVQVPVIEGTPTTSQKKPDLSKPTKETVDSASADESDFREPLPNEGMASSKPAQPTPALEIPPPKKEVNVTGPVIVGPAPDEEEEEEDFAIRSFESDTEDMDLTPMVDVTFLLLIFFMISASFSLQKTMPYPPPEPDEDGASTIQQIEELQETAVTVEIDENNVIMIGEDREVIQDPALVAEKIAQYARTQNSQEVLLTSHPQALTDTVIWVFDSAAEAGIQRTSITTYKP